MTMIAASTRQQPGATLKVRYATTLDRNFLVRALCLYDSWREFVPDGEFGFYCMDEDSAQILEQMKPERAVVVRHEQFAFDDLLAVRATRSMPEYCWTSKPAILLHALRDTPNLDWVVYLDSDMMMFGNIEQALTQAGQAAFLLTSHRFHAEFAAYAEQVGDFNAGFVAFRNCPNGRQALEWWMSRCLEWCGAVPVPGKYADQKYLDRLPGLFDEIMPVMHGLNVAPWNINNYPLTTDQSQVYVGDEPLLLFHFQGLRLHGYPFCDMYSGAMKLRKDVVDLIYRPHLERLKGAMNLSQLAGGDARWGTQPLALNPRLFYWQLRKFLGNKSNLALML